MEAIKQVLTSLDFKSSSRIIDAMINPKSEAERTALALSPDHKGFFVFQTDGIKGVYVWDGAVWLFFGDSTTVLAAISDLRNYVDSQDASEVAERNDAIDALNLALTSYINTEDEAHLLTAKTYADSLKAIADAAIVAALVEAKAYAETQDDVVKTALLGNIATLELSLKSYADTGDVSTLNAAKAYADAINATLLATITALEGRIIAIENVTQDGVEATGVLLSAGVDYILVLPKPLKSKSTFSTPNVMHATSGHGILEEYWSIDPTHIGFRVNADAVVDIYLEVDFAE